ncbi:MAG: TlpA family protein disulfide reductase [Burkholderiaceae bacterium]|jgi:thiol-disulfide isomerase/thioredoxin
MRDIESQSAEHLPAELAQVFNTARRGVLRRAGLLGLLASGAFYGGPAAFAQAAGGFAKSASPSLVWTLELGKPVQLPKLELLNGRPWKLDDHRGKVVMLEFWHSRCPFCMKQNPLLDAFFKEHESKGLEVVTVTIDKKKADAEKYMKDHGYKFGAGLADATWHAIYKSRKGLPQLFVIDRQGVLQAIELGEMFPDELAELKRFL